METLYNLESMENYINNYIAAGGEAITLQEGSLGLGLVLLYGDKLKTVVIQEVPITSWSSGHKIRKYNKMPKKYQVMLEKVLNE